MAEIPTRSEGDSGVVEPTEAEIAGAAPPTGRVSMSKAEVSLLLFLETCAVDRRGKVQAERMNAADFEIAKRWNTEGFVRFGRVAAEDITQGGSHWCRLSDEAWELAHAARRARGERMWLSRTWQTTEEKRAPEAT